MELRGIDVSAWQRKIDWKKVADYGMDFAMIRIKEKNTLSATTGWNNESKQSAINRRMRPKKKHYCPCENSMIWIA